MHKRSIAVAATMAVLQMAARGLCATVPVEQIEAYENYPTNTAYAPTDFNGSSAVLETTGDGGQFYGITFNADPALSPNFGTDSGHANTVGDFMYGSNTPAYPYVKQVYNTAADQFLNIVLGIPPSPDPNVTGVGPLPGGFLGGSKVINNSYVGGEMTNDAYLDDNRRLDYTINQADVVWVAGAVSDGAGFTQPQFLAWSNFNALAVSGVQNGQQSLNPSGSPGKQHADLSVPNMDASFGTGVVSGYAAALWGTAATANQADAQHGALVRSLLMAGADKGVYARPSNASNTTAGALDPVNGAGQPDYDRSLSILQGGEKSLLTVGTPGSIGTTQQGWTYGNIAAGSQSVVLFQSSNTLTGLTASLNWNVTSQATGSTLNTATSAVIFPNLALDVCPVIYNSISKTYSMGAIESSFTLQSAVAGDNVQYLYSTTSLPAGSYAFLITGDPALTATVGFSYSLSGTFVSRWNVSGGGTWSNTANWTNEVPNGQAAQVNLLSGTTGPTTITLDGDRTLGQLIFISTNSYTIAQGTVLNGVTGQLIIDDTGDSSGTNNPLISVQSGNHTISAPVALSNGLTANVSSGSQLTISGALTGNGTLNEVGPGTLTLDNVNIPSINQTAGLFNIPTGANVTFSSSAQITGSGVVNLIGGALNVGSLNLGGSLSRLNWSAGTLNFAGSNLTIGSGGPLGSSVTLTAGHTLEVTGGATLALVGTLNISGGGLSVPNLWESAGALIDAGTFTLAATGGNAVACTISGGTFNVGILNQSGGTFTVPGTFSLAGSGGNAVTDNLSGGSFLVGSLNLSSGGNLNWSAGVLNLTNSSLLIGTGGLFNPTLTLATGKTLEITGSGQALLITGTLNLNGGTIVTSSLNVSAGGVFNWTAGTLNITGTGSNFNGNINIPNNGILKLDGAIINPALVNDGGIFDLDANTGAGILVRQLNNITVAASGQANALAAGALSNRQLIVASTLNIAGSTNSWTGQFDLANNDLDVSGGNLTTITNQIKQGYNNGTWNGAGGIGSTTAASNSTHLTALGVIQNNQGGLPRFSAVNPFDTYYPGGSDILIKYTYYGDANLDGKVDGSDYSLIDNAFAFNQTHTTSQLTGWYNGDFNYDGVINGSDYTLIDNAYDTQGAAIQTAIATSQVSGPTSGPSAGPSSAVPEPSMVGLLGVIALRSLSRRKKSPECDAR